MGNRVAIILFIAGLFLIALSIVEGEAKAGIFIIFPFIYGSGGFLLFGVLFIFLSMLLFILSFPHQFEETDYEVEERKGGLLLIGPIPIVITEDKTIGIILISIAILIILAFLVLSFIKI